MKKPKAKGLEIKGHLDIQVDNREEEFEGEVTKWQEVLIHGDPKGLKSFAKLLTKLAEIEQKKVKDLPVGAREHYHLSSNFELGQSSVDVVVGRLDAKGTGEFYDSYKPNKLMKKKSTKKKTKTNR